MWLHLGWTFWLGSGVAPQAESLVKLRFVVRQCGGEMRVVEVTLRTRLDRANPADRALGLLRQWIARCTRVAQSVEFETSPGRRSLGSCACDQEKKPFKSSGD